MLYINHDIDKPEENDGLDGRRGGRAKLARAVQKKAILRELEAMIRLRSPHTVNVYGAVTSLPDRLILVMELLVGGDLRAFLRNAEDPLPEQQARQMIGDICAGMMFLHSKNTIHGDLKSANVLLDGAGRAKVGILVTDDSMPSDECVPGAWESLLSEKSTLLLSAAPVLVMVLRRAKIVESTSRRPCTRPPDWLQTCLTAHANYSV